MIRRSYILKLTVVFASVFLPPASSAQQTTSTASTALKNISKLEVEVVYLQKDGCFPKQITRPQGQKFRLYVVNKSGSPNVQLSLQAAASASVQSQKQFAALDSNWLQLIDLPAGTYTLTSNGSQKFGCTLVLK